MEPDGLIGLVLTNLDFFWCEGTKVLFANNNNLEIEKESRPS